MVLNTVQIIIFGKPYNEGKKWTARTQKAFSTLLFYSPCQLSLHSLNLFQILLLSPSPSFPKPVTTLAVSHSALSAADRERDREHGSALALSGSASLPSLSLSGSTKPRRTSLTALRAEDDLSEDEDEAVVRVGRLLVPQSVHMRGSDTHALCSCVFGGLGYASVNVNNMLLLHSASLCSIPCPRA